MLCVPHYYECDGPGRMRVGKTVLRLFLSIFLLVWLYNDKPTSTVAPAAANVQVTLSLPPILITVRFFVS